MDEHLGYEKHKISDNPNYRNGTNKKTLKSKYADVDVAIPRDRDGSFQPQFIKKRETLPRGSEDLILSLYTKGMSVRDIQEYLDDLYGYQLSEQTISNITGKIIEKAKEWQNRLLEPIYSIIFMDVPLILCSPGQINFLNVVRSKLLKYIESAISYGFIYFMDNL